MLIGVCVLAFLFVAVSAWLWRARRLRLKNWLGAFALVGWVVGVGVKVHLDQRTDTRIAATAAALPSLAWPSAGLERGLERPAQTTVPSSDDGLGPVQAAPVSSLVGGLEQRLAAQPDDVSGWALLAQSYAFIGDAAAADGAVRKAVALGMDEQELRSRVDVAMRGSHPN